MMTTKQKLKCSIIVTSLLACAMANADDAGAPAPTRSVPACMQVTTESRYVPYGYNHIVVLKNGCSKNVTCVISTDVNPEKQKIEIPSNTTQEVSTFLGSPSSTFVANVNCK